MKRVSKKLLSLFSVGLLFLNSGIGLVNYRAMATNPVASQSENLGENEFFGEGGKVYILGERCGSGNEAVVYGCTRKEEKKTDKPGEQPKDEKPAEEHTSESQEALYAPSRKEDKGDFVVKISIADLRRENLGSKNERDIVLKILRNPLLERDTTFQGELTVEHKGPPPAPHKPVCKAESGLNLSVTSKLLDFRDMGDDSDDDIDSKEKSDFNIDEFLGKDSDNGENISDEDEVLFKRCKKNCESGAKKSSAASVPVCSPKLGDAGAPHSPKKSPLLSKKPTPDAVCSGTVKLCVQAALRRNSVSGLVPIASFIPHVEKRFPFALSQYLSESRNLPKEETQLFDWTAKILDNILNALLGLNAMDICHRDVKSSNILVDKLGNASLGDLGSACYSNEAAQDCMGTRGYMAPEVFDSSPRNPRNPRICAKADVFSLGLVALEILTSDFKAIESLSPEIDIEDYYASRNKDILSKIDSLHLRVGDKAIPEQWKRFFRACLDPNPETRVSASQAKELLQKAVNF
ncbi:MAG: protein kinase [Clostridia bacterium]|nr:protein kinase [Clostridia bacterium]